MKLTAILLLIGTMHLAAASYGQRVTITRSNTTLETVFKDIKQQTGFLFFYNGQVNTTSHLLSVDLKNVPIEEALDKCLIDQELTYTIVNKTIVIRNKLLASTPVMSVTNQSQTTGKVVEGDTRNPVPGVNIVLKNNKTIHTQSNDKGEFTIAAAPGDILQFTYIGFKPKELKVIDTKFIIVNLEPQVNAMNDVVVTGYQTIKKETYTGNAITITGDELKRLNPQDIIKSIASFDPSFKILDNNLLGSDPNALPKINVRGATTLPPLQNNILDKNNLSSSYNLPAFILDGFEVTLEKVTDMDINRIASITILKDAAATAVYGSRAANGVIVITTKTPIPGKLQLSYNYELNITAPDLSGYHILNASQKLQYEKLAGLYTTTTNDAYSQDQLDAIYYSKLKNVVSGVNTYWLSQPLQNTFGEKHSLSAQGGDSTFRYGVDLRYQTSPGVMKGSARNRYSTGINFNYNPNSKILFKNEITVTQVNAKVSNYGDFSTYATMNPYYPKTDSVGNIIREIANWKVDTHQSGSDQYKNQAVYNPLFEASLGNFNKSSNLELIDAFSADMKITPSLRLKGLMSVTKTKYTSDVFVSPLSNTFYNDPDVEIQNRGSYTYASNDSFGLDGNITLLYNKQIKDNYFNLALGSNIISRKDDDKAFEATGFANDRFTNIGFARTYLPDSAPAGDVILNRSIGNFFSGNYSYKNKYLLDASFRLDGSSAFGANSRFAPFWATGIGWNMHKEDFMKEFPVISKFKLSASAGETGSVSFPAYLSKSIYSYQTSNWYSTGIGAVVDGYGNENLQWQKTTNYDVGLDLGLFHDRFLITPRYYYKLTKGLLTDINLAPSTGFTTYKDNLGNIANKGYEIYLTWNAYRAKDWNINITGNLAHNTNKLVKIANSLKAYNQSIDDFQSNPDNNVESSPLLRYNEGQSLNTIYAVKSMGIDPQNGKEIYVKKDGSLTYVYDIKDTEPVGDTTPKAEGYFGTNITYKQFMLSLSFYYRFGGDLYNQTLVDRVENADPRGNVDSRALDQKWINPGDITFYKNIADLSPTYASSRFVQKDNQLNLQSVYLSYDFKKATAKKFGFMGLRAAVTTNDVLHFSSIDMERGIDYPYARSCTFSLQATF
ncbi:SusC/RagA family TonB-linked outer membrane protein [Pedobacter sp. L105]|uniref:SusC/RagA family TonB-linked outer membrane protein n=1 Tax=Pedobacter sp. L105 TaxID=1641871 RepID=UPI0020B13018|nr:SusC/RagA family TonB-linked outer membrane protein [Pedobacter sp. L105]